MSLFLFIFCILRYTYIHLITLIQYIYPSPFAEVYLHIFIAVQLSGKTSLWCRAENRTRACLTAIFLLSRFFFNFSPAFSPDNFSKSLETVFRAKNTQILSCGSGSGIWNLFDPGSGIRDGKFRSGIRDKYPGPATLKST
jgi:hypothetical protein